MNWWSETAVLWLPAASSPVPADFAARPEPGNGDFHYYALDAFDAIISQRSEQVDHKPWAYVLTDQQILSPGEIDELTQEWREEMRAVAATEFVTLGNPSASGAQS